LYEVLNEQVQVGLLEVGTSVQLKYKHKYHKSTSILAIIKQTKRYVHTNSLIQILNDTITNADRTCTDKLTVEYITTSVAQRQL